MLFYFWKVGKNWETLCILYVVVIYQQLFLDKHYQSSVINVYIPYWLIVDIQSVLVV